eukprot:5249062-Pleurochrysis_carterae.AAC.1
MRRPEGACACVCPVAPCVRARQLLLHGQRAVRAPAMAKSAPCVRCRRAFARAAAVQRRAAASPWAASRRAAAPAPRPPGKDAAWESVEQTSRGRTTRR